jgi:EmrB/QacA subfamily drug resistance transporter
MEAKKKWWALAVLCCGVLMIVLDTTIVNIALPSIRNDLGFSEASLVWVVNAYLLTFGGFLLLSGRLGDLYGRRKLFLIGITFFTLASLLCGLSHTQWLLITARALQGLGGALVTAVALSLIMNLFPESKERARAMGFYSFVAAAGGSVGVLLGGVLTNSYDWHWNFLINIPIGIIVFICSLFLVPPGSGEEADKHLDIWGTVTVTLASLIAVYAIVGGNQYGWLTLHTLILFAIAIILIIVFIKIERKVTHPLMPLDMFKLHNLRTANIMAVLWAAAMFTWFFIAALYLQLILKYNPLQVGLAFLPGNIIMALFSLGLSAKLIMRFGIKKPLAIGLFFAALGFLYLARAPLEGNFLIDVLPSMILLGLGGGMAFNPMFIAAMDEVPPNESGLASGLLNMSFMMGGAFGLALLASLAAIRTTSLMGRDVEQLIATNSGYHVAFIAGAFLAIGASLLGLFHLRTNQANKRDSTAQASFH